MTPVRGIEGSIRLAGGQHEGSGEPVMVKDLPLRADKGQVEPNIRSWLQIWSKQKFQKFQSFKMCLKG